MKSWAPVLQRLPPCASGQPSPTWTGRGFVVGERTVPVLEYSSDLSGWDDALTTMHEDAAGGQHPIDMASRRLAIRALRRYLTNQAGSILEIGCSSGFLLPDIRSSFPAASVLGADVVKQPLFALAAKMPDLPLFRFDLGQCPLPAESIDAVVMLNVLEHIKDDHRALLQVHRILKPDGLCIIEVPAGPGLYDYYDEHLRHYRRYTERGLIEACRSAGLSRATTSHLGFFLYPAFSWIKKRNRRNPPRSSSEAEIRIRRHISDSRSNLLMGLLMSCEASIAELLSITYRVGIRCVGVFRKDDARSASMQRN